MPTAAGLLTALPADVTAGGGASVALPDAVPVGDVDVCGGGLALPAKGLAGGDQPLGPLVATGEVTVDTTLSWAQVAAAPLVGIPDGTSAVKVGNPNSLTFFSDRNRSLRISRQNYNIDDLIEAVGKYLANLEEIEQVDLTRNNEDSIPGLKMDDICYKCAAVADHYSTLCPDQFCIDCERRGHRGDACAFFDFDQQNRKYGIVADQYMEKTRTLTTEERSYLDYCVNVLVQQKSKKEDVIRRSARLRKESL